MPTTFVRGRPRLLHPDCVYLRYAVHFLVIAICSAVTHVAFARTGSFAIGGGFLKFMISTMTLVTGAAGTMFYTNQPPRSSSRSGTTCSG